MTSKNTQQLAFRIPVKYLDMLNDEVKASRRSRASWCRYVITERYNEMLELSPPIGKLLFYNRIKRERVRLSGPSIVVTARLPNELAAGIREMAQRDGNTTSEWLGTAILRRLC